MTIQQKLRYAAAHPENWDVPGLLRDAANALDCLLPVVHMATEPHLHADAELRQAAKRALERLNHVKGAV